MSGSAAKNPVTEQSLLALAASAEERPRYGGTLRVQLYRATEEDWLETGRWLNRIEVPARADSVMSRRPIVPKASVIPAKASASSSAIPTGPG